MSNTCPTCGHPIPPKPVGTDPQMLLSALAVHGPNGSEGSGRDVYKTRDGRWVLTYGHHSYEPAYWSAGMIQDLAYQGLIEPTYDGCADSFKLPAPLSD